MPKKFIINRANSFIFSRNNYRVLLTLGMLFSALAILLLIFTIYLHLTEPKPILLATTSDGEIIELNF